MGKRDRHEELMDILLDILDELRALRLQRPPVPPAPAWPPHQHGAPVSPLGTSVVLYMAAGPSRGTDGAAWTITAATGNESKY